MQLNKTLPVGIFALFLTGSAAAARSDWREMTVGHFHLYSTLRDSNTREVARQLQAFAKTVGTFLQGEDRLPDVPTNIYILDNGDFQKYGASRPGLAGVFYERPYANVIVINGDLAFDEVKVTVFHEYTHFIQRNSTTKEMPPWFVEGYAELFSGFTLKRDKITVGGLPVGVGMYLDEWIPMDRILAVKHTDPEYRAERLAPQFYGESWALVHLLLFDDKSLHRPTVLYLEDLGVGVLEPDAFAQAFPFDKAALDKAVHKLVMGRAIHVITVTYPAAIAVDEAPITAMTAAQADVELTRLAFTLDRPQKLIATLAAAALKENGSNAGVRALCARIAARDGDLQDISELTSTLAAGGTNDAQLRIDLAATLLTGNPTSEAAAHAFALLDDLAHTDAAPLEAIELWAAAAYVSHVQPVKLSTVLENASARAPHNTRILGRLALVQEMLGENAKARDYYNRIILVSDRPDERLWAQKQADSERLQKN
jgi:hypothetical protein